MPSASASAGSGHQARDTYSGMHSSASRLSALAKRASKSSGPDSPRALDSSASRILARTSSNSRRYSANSARSSLTEASRPPLPKRLPRYWYNSSASVNEVGESVAILVGYDWLGWESEPKG